MTEITPYNVQNVQIFQIFYAIMKPYSLQRQLAQAISDKEKLSLL